MYELIQKQVLSTSAASFVFNSIPQNYTDFKIFLSSRGSDGTGYGRIVFNSTIESTKRRVYGTGSSYGSDANSSVDFRVNGSDQTASTFGSAEITVFNYSNTNYIKSYLVDSFNENNATYAVQQMVAGRAGTTNPITRIDLIAAGGNFVAGSSATLYGVNRTSAIGKPKAIGGNITYSNGYWVHTFTGSGTFYAQQYLEVDALVVAGGGAGGATQTSSQRGSGGGGGGGVVALSTALSRGSYPLTVGAGGVPVLIMRGLNGSNSSFLNSTALGGGGGGGGFVSSGAGANGGSGGGGYSEGVTTAGGSGTSGQGNTGGSGYWTSTSNFWGGGGGGAGEAGNVDGNGSGGDGILWNGSYYAGGGGGATSSNYSALGGEGGGANGPTGSGAVSGNNGSANTGGGGSGALSLNEASPIGGIGGSGVVIIRYRAD